MLARAWYTRPESNSLTAPDHYKSSQLSDPIGALTGVVLRSFDLLPSLVAKDADKAPAVCFCQPVAATISANVASPGPLN